MNQKDENIIKKLKYTYLKETTEKQLNEYIDLYNDLASQPKTSTIDEFVISRKETLHDINRIYKAQLKLLKDMDADISQYPSSLEDLTK